MSYETHLEFLELARRQQGFAYLTNLPNLSLRHVGGEHDLFLSRYGIKWLVNPDPCTFAKVAVTAVCFPCEWCCLAHL